MNGCREVDPLLSAWIDRSLSSAERILVNAHLSSCARCRAEVATLVQVAGLLAAIPCRALPPQLRQTLAPQRAEGPRRTRPRPAHLLAPTWITASATPAHSAWMALVILALAGFLSGGVRLVEEGGSVPGGATAPDRVAESTPRPVLVDLRR